MSMHNLGQGCRAWIPPQAGWGWSNAGLVTGRDASLLVDTLYDLRLTGAMLNGFAPVTREAPIRHLVNTHGNGDHWFGNQLVAGAEIIATEGTIADMRQVGPEQMRALLRAPAPTGDFTRRIFGPFDYSGIAPAYPTRVYRGSVELDVGGVCVRLLDVGAAHSAGDTVVHVPHARTVYTGDLVFAGGTPVVWQGPFDNWLAACDLLLGLDIDTVVPGHGPVTGKDEIRAVRDYLEYVHEQAEARFRAGIPGQRAAREIPLGRFAGLGEPERLAVNVQTAYREFDPALAPLDGPRLFGCIAELAQLNEETHA